MKKSEIVAEVHAHPFLSFGNHRDLLALTVCSDFFCEADEDADFTEVIFAVEKEWLINYMNRDHKNWNVDRIRRWLREAYTSYDSIKIYEDALNDNAIVMVDFN